MAAGLGFIEFTTGDVLSAAAANGYLASQTVMVFADAAARTSAIASPQEGMFSFLKDTNATQFYDGATWVNLDTTGMVNPMTTTGDMIYSSSGTTPARLGIGTAGQVLTVNSGATAPEWATPAGGGGKVLQVIAATTATQAASSSSTYADTGLTATITPSAATSKILILMTQNGIRKQTNNTSLRLRLFRDATNIAQVANDAGDTNSVARNEVGSIAISYLDSPATTSAVTYKTQFNSSGNNAETLVQTGSAVSSIVLLEIGA
jgi:hypothetical protein